MNPMLNIIEREEASAWWDSIGEERRSLLARLCPDFIERYRKFSSPEVNGFFLQHRFLSNYHECPVEHEGILYGSSEAAYQAAKTENLAKRRLFAEMRPNQSKKEGQYLTLRVGWNDMKVSVMREVLMDKFTRNRELGLMLVSTAPVRFEETNWWGDMFWGVCWHNGAWRGENNLGKVLMDIRNILNNDIQ